MTDIVQRLRKRASRLCTEKPKEYVAVLSVDECIEASDEIARLRTDNDRLRHTLARMVYDFDRLNFRTIGAEAVAQDLLDLARNVGGFDDRLLTSTDLNLIRATLREFREQARAAMPWTMP